MANCPNCGAEVKEGFKFCLGCGAQIQAGTNQTASPSTNQMPQQQQTATPPMAQQMYAAVPPKKSNTKLIVGVVVAIIAIIVVVLVVVLLMGGSSPGDSSVVGTWEYEEPTTGMSLVYVFNSDGKVEAGSEEFTMEMGTWSTNGNQLCLSVQGIGEQCYTYSISGNQMTWAYMGETITLTKTS